MARDHGDIMVATTDTIVGKRIVRTVGLVRGNTIRARHLGHDIMAGLKNMVGGEITDYTKMIAESREEALDRMTAQAVANGANAVVGLLLGFLLAGALFVLVQFLSYLRLFLHDFHHLFPRGAARFQTAVLALMLLALPLMFRLGLVITLMIWLLCAWLYQNWRERVISVMVVLLLFLGNLRAALVVALALAAAVEGDSEHLIARSIRSKAKERNITPLAVSDFKAIKGRGIRAAHNGREVYVGGPRLLEMLGLTLSDAPARFSTEAGRKGQSVIYLVDGQQVAAAFALADMVRPESRQAVRRLQEMGVEVAMLTGDSAAVAHAVAEELNISTVFAEVLPEHKDQKVAALQAQGKRVAMVGDGVNDAPALTRADVGIAIGSGTDVAIESAGIILVQSNPLDVVKIFELSRATYKKMVQNLIWATGYNVVALPLAAGVLASVGILLSPAVGALLMSLSTVIVAVNAQLLRRMDLG